MSDGQNIRREKSAAKQLTLEVHFLEESTNCLIMSRYQTRPTNASSQLCLWFVAILVLGIPGCSMSFKQLTFKQQASKSLVVHKSVPADPAKSGPESAEDPETTAAFDELLIARSNFANSSTLDSANSVKTVQLADRMSHEQSLEVVDYPGLDTIPGAGGWSPAVNHFDSGMQ